LNIVRGTRHLLDCLTRGADPLQVLGVYDEQYRRINNTWKISTLTLRFKWSGDTGHITDDNPMKILKRES